MRRTRRLFSEKRSRNEKSIWLGMFMVILPLVGMSGFYAYAYLHWI